VTEVHRVADSIYIADCEFGRGVFAARPIRRGETILRYRGPRFDRTDPIHHTERAAMLLQTGARTYILPDSPAVLVNHSCAPNAGLVDNRRLVAINDILPGEQVTFDYSTSMDDGIWTMECRCGHQECRGVVRDFQQLPERLRERYLALGIVQGFITRQYRQRSEDSGGYADAAIA
jgi:hypothetical protein